MRLPDRIQTPRLVIRPFVAEEADAFVTFMTDEETTTEFMFLPEQKTPDGARLFFDEILASYETEAPYFVCAIEPADGNEFVGACGISNLPDGEFECWVCLAPLHRGRGYATEAIRALIDYCFAQYPMDVFRACISPDNPTSVAIARRLGMEYAGRGTHPVHGDECEIFVLARVRRE
jgi:RimJ/RimL family protein N-acetyltransferase